MQLTSGTPYWLTRNGLPPAFPTLREDLICDVAVIGGGISGALVSDSLSRAGRKVVVLDQHYPGT
ncbi:MAG TPA: FAD-dependent oxidoreductase, partial [bacterium]|nr:FAD-dependent oxidoreductase [bacterium]